MALHKNSKLYRLKVAALKKARTARWRKVKARKAHNPPVVGGFLKGTGVSFMTSSAAVSDDDIRTANERLTAKDAPSSPFLFRLEAQVRNWVRDELEAILGG